MGISIVYPFYNHHVIFKHHLNVWNKYGREILDQIEFVIVDDHSYQQIEIDKRFDNLNIKVYRVLDDIVWNYGAKNLGVQEASGHWFLLSELDHLLPLEACKKILELPRDRGSYYMFKRRNHANHANKRYINTIHPATYYMSKSAFYDAGGIDEDFSGAYGYDDIFLVRCLNKKGYRKVIPDGIQFRNFSDNLEFPDADLKQDVNVPRCIIRNKRIFDQKLISMTPSEKKIRFKWERIYP